MLWYCLAKDTPQIALRHPTNASLPLALPSRIILYLEEKLGILFTATIGHFLASLSIYFMMIPASGR
jgi:hypothetical protein